MLARSLGKADIARLSQGRVDAELGSTALSELVDERADLVLVPSRSGASRELFRCRYSANDYFGNEGSDAFVYVMTMLIVDVPAAASRMLQGRLARHPKLGRGEVLSSRTSDGETFYTVRFEDGSERTVLASKLELLEP